MFTSAPTNRDPYVAIIINDQLFSMGASRIYINYLDGMTYSRGITGKKGYLISNTGKSAIDKIIIFDKDGKELYKKHW